MPKIILSVAIAQITPLFTNIVVIMYNLQDKRFYKVISLLIKTIILILSFWYILIKINAANNSIDFTNLFNESTVFFLSFTLLLMPVNWGLEALKWKILIHSLEPISFVKSFKSIFSGITISIFTPNRVGEFAGRIFYLEKADKIKATIKSFVGSIIQLSVTLLIGLTSLFFYYYRGYDSSHPIVAFENRNVKLFLIIICGILICLLFLYLAKKYFSTKIKSYFNIFFETKGSQVIILLGLSFLRYIIFSVQYYLALKVFNIHLDFALSFMLISIVFLVTSIIPTFAISEIAVRGATAVYFFSVVTNDSKGIVAASLLLWLINLAIPALIGEVFVWKLKFFKNQK
ncbi:MAG: hypothetical protein A3F72_04645 [Bacteroidetes bacterium RIFCSPLOWO2_12_FULL_35_15]|nr:MAG: hypothetical protein A3F72_04645 [Bacteroidetes bacterium RIFCSPLOWO2_12_FULL_35_15]